MQVIRRHHDTKDPKTTPLSPAQQVDLLLQTPPNTHRISTPEAPKKKRRLLVYPSDILTDEELTSLQTLMSKWIMQAQCMATSDETEVQELVQIIDKHRILKHRIQKLVQAIEDHRPKPDDQIDGGSGRIGRSKGRDVPRGSMELYPINNFEVWTKNAAGAYKVGPMILERGSHHNINSIHWIWNKQFLGNQIWLQCKTDDTKFFGNASLADPVTKFMEDVIGKREPERSECWSVISALKNVEYSGFVDDFEGIKLRQELFERLKSCEGSHYGVLRKSQRQTLTAFYKSMDEADNIVDESYEKSEEEIIVVDHNDDDDDDDDDDNTTTASEDSRNNDDDCDRYLNTPNYPRGRARGVMKAAAVGATAVGAAAGLGPCPSAVKQMIVGRRIKGMGDALDGAAASLNGEDDDKFVDVDGGKDKEEREEEEKPKSKITNDKTDEKKITNEETDDDNDDDE